VLLKLAPSEITCQHPKLKTFHTFPIAPQQ
jgi:hypothetical protein